ncbi:penicillin-binding protein [Thalassospira profundimaris]|uniref:peptidoglycan glycosyltransferase n=1 Tax=Thalassospira profundimaris TaxID=502049 RepID=A0A367WMC0_9PROT|nr:transglycosylase domain-containing protein [Thalassospira profundimaris]RCK42584.1 penicillin-binding protein [Thalassospira profundimaris]
MDENNQTKKSGVAAAQAAVKEIEDRERREIRRRKRRILLAIIAFILLILAGIATLLTLSIRSQLDFSRKADRSPTVQIADFSGTIMTNVQGHYSQDVSLITFPERLQRVFIVAADPGFYHHFGAGFSDVMRILSGDAAPGSTITMKVARSFFEVPASGSIRNLEEMLVALWLEARFDKDTILRSYLERRYVGSGIFGITAASRIFYGVPAHKMSLHQAAVLAAAMNDPARLNPLQFPRASAQAANIILQKMATGNTLTAAQINALMRDVPQLEPRSAREDGQEQYVIDLVMDEVARRVGYTSKDLQVVTSIDHDLQEMAQSAVNEVSRVRLRPRGADQAALLAISPDGRVRAMVGGTQYDPVSRNRAWNVGHYPGRMIKILPYYYALNENPDPAQWVPDTRREVEGWKPVNPDRQYRGQVPLRDAFARDVNTVPVELTHKFGLENMRDFARKVGIQSPLSNDIRTVVGLDPVTLPDIARLHTLSLNGGISPDITLINEIRSTAEGHPLLYERVTRKKDKVLTDEAMLAVNSMLAGVTDPQVRLDRPFVGFGARAGRGSDAWFAGFTADLYAVVWVGNDDGSPAQSIRPDVEVASLWRLFMLDASQGFSIRSVARGTSQRLIEQDGVSDMWKRHWVDPNPPLQNNNP